MSASYYRLGKYSFDFTTPSGLFTLVNSEGDAFYEPSLRYFEKALSHVLWIFFWLSILVVTHQNFSFLWLEQALMSLVFIHLFLFGCRLTTLLVNGGIKPLLFPPLWIKLTRKMQKGQGLELLKKHHLDDHPGLLVNLALIQFHQRQTQLAEHTFQQALSLLPDHPLLLQLLPLFAIDSYPSKH